MQEICKNNGHQLAGSGGIV